MKWAQTVSQRNLMEEGPPLLKHFLVREGTRKNENEAERKRIMDSWVGERCGELVPTVPTPLSERELYPERETGGHLNTIHSISNLLLEHGTQLAIREDNGCSYADGASRAM